MMKVNAIILASGLALGTAFPGTALAESAQLKKCLANIDMNALTNSQRLACATTDMDRADGTLNATYKTVKSRLSVSRQRQLVLEERRWIKHRHDTCAEANFERALNPPGKTYTVPGANYFRMQCLVDETDKRTAQLRRWH